ncbi:AraC family transcriptional regulator N-terminal domain-containing protein [Bdellovibrio bacteriovorus]|uniref:AraC family transcriptional regulator n=1 Tax=Bdellovibrio bacteriovorus TaxID=959 RepID=UPI0035A71BF1
MESQKGSKNPKSTMMAPLAQVIERHISKAGDHKTAVPNLSLHRRDSVGEPIPCIYSLGIGLTVQGEKQILVNEKVVKSYPGVAILTTVDLPVIAHMTQATSREPYLGVLVTLDMKSLMQTASELKLPRPKEGPFDPLAIGVLDGPLMDAIRRLVELLNEPELIPRLAPLIQQEINVRLLKSSYGPHLQRLLLEDAPIQQIAKVVNWMKENFAKVIRMDELAEHANMSPSTFRQHFRNITGTSPLQFQKQLRLQEARQLMLNQNYDAGQASGIVGYESASQFSREYSRLFGEPPQRDIQRLRST